VSLPIRFACLVVAASLLAPQAFANDDEKGYEPYEGYRLDWSGTFLLHLRDFESPADDDDVTGFFDLHEFTRNKDEQPSVGFGLGEFDLDLFAEEETPLLQLRLDSPTSNLNFSGQTFRIDEFFLNQRAELFARPRGLELDLDYRRMLNDEMRVYPNPTDQTGALGFGEAIATRFNDDTSADDRFFVRRGRIGGELRVRPWELFEWQRTALTGFLSEAAIRGGYEERKGKRQLRYLLGFSDGVDPVAPGNALWRGITGEVDQRVDDAGAGLVFSPGGLFTLAVDFDHQRFRNQAPTIFQTRIRGFDPGNIGAGFGFDQIPNTLDDQGLRTVGFIPETDRSTGSVRMSARLGERAVIHGGLQLSSLDQEGDLSPFQEIAGLRDNKVVFYSGNLAADFELMEALSLNAFYKFDRRSNRLPRDTDYFNGVNGTQIDPFLEDVRRDHAGVELVYRFLPMNLVAAGWRGLWVDRDLAFASPFDPRCLTATSCTLPGLVGPNLAILADNAVVHEETRMYTFYLRTALRPIAGLQLSGEGGYRNAPETGYSRELDDLRYAQIRSSYVLPLKTPVTLSFFGRAQRGENHDFTLQTVRSVFRNGEVEREFSPPRDRDFERDGFSWGLTLTGSPHRALTLFASGFQHRDDQDIDLFRSTELRYQEPFALFNTFVDLDFFKDTALRYRSDHTTLILGGTVELGKRTETSVAYTFTRTNAALRSDGLTANTLDGWSRIRGDIHRVQFEIGHWLRDGLRVSFGYNFDQYRDRAGTPTGVGSAAPFDPSTSVHTFVFGVTLNSDLRR
jgi:hypothetical protein